jgi:hypothetical protein
MVVALAMCGIVFLTQSLGGVDNRDLSPAQSGTLSPRSTGGVNDVSSKLSDKYSRPETMGTVPIFMTTKDRLWVLKESIKSYQNYISTPIHIIIYDTGSTYAPMVAYLKALEQKPGFTVMYDQKAWPRNAVWSAIKQYLDKHPETKYYVLTDPDIVLDPNGGDILEYYAYLLDNFDVPFAGPQLRINDVDKKFPLYNSIVKRHSKYWNSPPEHTTFRGRTYHYVMAHKDTMQFLCFHKVSARL